MPYYAITYVEQFDPAEFVQQWSELYKDKKEDLYMDNIGQLLTRERIRNLFTWKKAGMPFNQQTIETHFVNSCEQLNQLPFNTSPGGFPSCAFYSGWSHFADIFPPLLET